MKDARITTRRRALAESARELGRLVAKADRSNALHAELRAANKCINTTARTPRHGRVFKRGRCRRCYRVLRKGES